jgi:hypothetical protein
MSCEPKKGIRSSVGRVSHFTTAWVQHLTVNVREFFKHHISDSVDHAIATSLRYSLHTPRDQVEKHRARCGCTLICGGKTSVDQAARFDPNLTRYLGLFTTCVPLPGRSLPSRFPFFAITSAAADRSRFRNSS